MKEYKVIKETFLENLEKKVTEYLNSGWKCQGGLSIYVVGNIKAYAQAMIKN